MKIMLYLFTIVIYKSNDIYLWPIKLNLRLHCSLLSSPISSIRSSLISSPTCSSGFAPLAPCPQSYSISYFSCIWPSHHSTCLLYLWWLIAHHFRTLSSNYLSSTTAQLPFAISDSLLFTYYRLAIWPIGLEAVVLAAGFACRMHQPNLALCFVSYMPDQVAWLPRSTSRHSLCRSRHVLFLTPH